MDYIVLKWLHILSSTLLFGTGLGSAFYMFFASLTRDARVVAVVVRYVVIADWAFTTPTIILQPLTGFYLVHRTGLPLTSTWIRYECATWLGRLQQRAVSYPIGTGASCDGGSRWVSWLFSRSSRCSISWWRSPRERYR
jgi:hypothetical protein